MEDNKYLLVMMVAKRAKELKKGAKPLVESKNRKPTIIALKEIKEGKVYLKEKKEPLKSEDVFHEEEESLKVEEPIKPEGIFNEDEKPVKIKKPVKSEKLPDEDRKPVEIEEIFDENKESKKFED